MSLLSNFWEDCNEFLLSNFPSTLAKILLLLHFAPFSNCPNAVWTKSYLQIRKVSWRDCPVNSLASLGTLNQSALLRRIKFASIRRILSQQSLIGNNIIFSSNLAEKLLYQLEIEQGCFVVIRPCPWIKTVTSDIANAIIEPLNICNNWEMICRMAGIPQHDGKRQQISCLRLSIVSQSLLQDC